jgi:hypothetical protein
VVRATLPPRSAGGSRLDARREAERRLGGRYEVRVLQPSPPAVTNPPWFADDPVARGDVPPGRRVVSPVATGDVTWDELARNDHDLATWCADRWLGAWRPLPPAPPDLTQTGDALHAVAEHVLRPARQAANGKIGLRYTHNGFGTPFFGDARQVRVEGDLVVVDEGGTERPAPLSTIADSARFVGVDLGQLDSPYELTTPLEPDRPLEIDGPTSLFLGDVYGFGALALETIRAEAGPSDDVSPVQLWPEHFDLAFEMGDEGAGHRAGYGISPGDEDHAEPYLYVVPWQPPGDDGFWNDLHFRGASLPWADLVAATDARAAAVEFFTTGQELMRQRDR